MQCPPKNAEKSHTFSITLLSPRALKTIPPYSPLGCFVLPPQLVFHSGKHSTDIPGRAFPLSTSLGVLLWLQIKEPSTGFCKQQQVWSSEHALLLVSAQPEGSPLQPFANSRRDREMVRYWEQPSRIQVGGAVSLFQQQLHMHRQTVSSGWKIPYNLSCFNKTKAAKLQPPPSSFHLSCVSQVTSTINQRAKIPHNEALYYSACSLLRLC